ncbi:MAG: hypothetical protein LBE17_13430 [Treponema sp.]|jgi:hypothetical protein|nr:hypothetical protein [Treponema sp.]
MGTDWYPNSRDGQLHLVKTWATVFASSGQAWGIPPNRITHLANNAVAARAIPGTVKSGGRIAADVVECNEAFKEMETEARFIKKRFLAPPLTPDDLPALLLPLPGDHTPLDVLKALAFSYCRVH